MQQPLIAQFPQGPAHMHRGQPQRIADMGQGQRYLDRLAGYAREGTLQPEKQPDQEMRQPAAGVPAADILDMVIGPHLIAGDDIQHMTHQPDILGHGFIEPDPRHHQRLRLGQAHRRMIAGGAGTGMDAEKSPRQREIQNLIGAVLQGRR